LDFHEGGWWAYRSRAQHLTAAHEVLAEIASGLSNAEIARKFQLSDTTVKTHVNHLLAKTAMRDRAQLVAYAFRLGLVR